VARVQALDSQFEDRVYNSVKKVVREEVLEAKMKEERSLNIVVKNLPEDKPDSEAWAELVQAMGVTDAGDISKCSRIGTAGTNGRPRPLKVECTSNSQKQKLRNSSKLASATEEKFRGIFLNRDLTRSEQAEQKQFREDLKRMKEENPNKRFVIKRNRVVEASERGQGGRDSADVAKNGSG
jgi:hypothetical protein